MIRRRELRCQRPASAAETSEKRLTGIFSDALVRRCYLHRVSVEYELSQRSTDCWCSSNTAAFVRRELAAEREVVEDLRRSANHISLAEEDQSCAPQPQSAPSCHLQLSPSITQDTIRDTPSHLLRTPPWSGASRNSGLQAHHQHSSKAQPHPQTRPRTMHCPRLPSQSQQMAPEHLPNPLRQQQPSHPP